MFKQAAAFPNELGHRNATDEADDNRKEQPMCIVPHRHCQLWKSPGEIVPNAGAKVELWGDEVAKLLFPYDPDQDDGKGL
jgi:hypothetical protein